MSLRCWSIARWMAHRSPERALLTFEERERGWGVGANWCSGEPISCKNADYRGLLINLRVMITTYIKEEYIGDGRTPTAGTSQGRIDRPALPSRDMLTAKLLIRCQKFIRPLFNIAYLSRPVTSKQGVA